MFRYNTPILLSQSHAFVLAAPVLKKNVMTTIQALKGKRRYITCEVDHSNPKPKISWTMQYLPYSCITQNDPFSGQSCQPKKTAWTARDMQIYGGRFSPPNGNVAMKSSYTPPIWMQCAYYQCTAQNVFGSESMVFRFRRH